MIIKRISALLLLSFLLIYSGCSRQETPKKVLLGERSAGSELKTETPSEDTLWFGFDLRLDPKEEIRIYAPFLKYLQEKTGYKFRIKFTENYEDTVENLGKGVTQFASIGTLSYVIGQEKFGIKYLVSGVNHEGDPMYYAAIIARPGSRIKTVEDLRGKSFCFGSLMSTQGHLIPRKMLEDKGITLKNLSHYHYTGSHINAANTVMTGECDAGGIQDTLAHKLVAEGKVKIIGFSEPYPSSLIAYNADLDSNTVLDIKFALLAFEPKGSHMDMLYDWDKTEMPLGFMVIREFEIDKVTALAKKYGLIKNSN